MTEQVIDIRDRIEKMRNQMTVPNSQGKVQEKKIKFDKTELSNNAVTENTISNDITNKTNESGNSANQKYFKSQAVVQNKNERPVKSFKSESNTKVEIDEVIKEEKRHNFNDKDNFKVYEDYHNDRVKDEKKQSVKFDEKQPFPQFSLNVSNPISWKLMLLIMLMQLLTNMMLVIVLYLK